MSLGEGGDVGERVGVRNNRSETHLQILDCSRRRAPVLTLVLEAWLAMRAIAAAVEHVHDESSGEEQADCCAQKGPDRVDAAIVTERCMARARGRALSQTLGNEAMALFGNDPLDDDAAGDERDMTVRGHRNADGGGQDRLHWLRCCCRNLAKAKGESSASGGHPPPRRSNRGRLRCPHGSRACPRTHEPRDFGFCRRVEAKGSQMEGLHATQQRTRARISSRNRGGTILFEALSNALEGE